MFVVCKVANVILQKFAVNLIISDLFPFLSIPLTPDLGINLYSLYVRAVLWLS